MSQLQDLQFPIDRAIFAEVLACLPKIWTRAKLIASIQSGPSASSSMTIRIHALGQAGIALVGEGLQDQVGELFSLNKRFDTGLRGIEYIYERRPDGRWSFVADYKYE